MRVGIFADVHMGNFVQFAKPWSGSLTTRAKICLDTFTHAYDGMLADSVKLVIVAGDLFQVSNPEPKLIRETAEVMEKIRSYPMLGNHDMETFAPNDNACAPLGLSERIEVVEERTVLSSGVGSGDMVLIPFQNGDPTKWLPKEVAAARADCSDAKALILHMGLSTDRTPAHMAHCQGAIKARELQAIATKHGFNRVFMGDWHNPDKWAPKGSGFEAHQISALIPASFSDSYKNIGRVAIYDTETGDVEFRTIPGPRFIKVHDVVSDLGKAKKEIAVATHLFVQVTCTPEDYEYKKSEVLTTLCTMGHPNILSNLHFVPKYQIVQARALAESACSAARDANSLGQAMQRWLSGRGLDTTIQAAVQGKVDGFIRRAGGEQS